MSFDLAGVASVFGDDESAVRWSYELLCKVVMFTFEISLPSVKPATGGIDERVSSSSRNKAVSFFESNCPQPSLKITQVLMHGNAFRAVTVSLHSRMNSSLPCTFFLPKRG